MKYEISLVLSPKLTDEEAKKESKNIEKKLTEFKSKILDYNFLGKKDLAYSIKHLEQGYFFILKFETEEDQIKKIDKSLKENSNIIRTVLAKYKKEAIKRIRKDKEKEKPKKEEKDKKNKEEEKADSKKDKKSTKNDLDTRLDKIFKGDIVD